MSKRLEQLLAQQEIIANRIRQARSKERSRARKADTRQRVLLGSLLQSMMEQDPALRADIMARLDAFLTRKIDREVFGLAGGIASEQAPTESAA
jgi:hypothetical protein